MEDHKVLRDHVDSVIAWANQVAAKFHADVPSPARVGAIFELLHLYTIYKLEVFRLPELEIRPLIEAHYAEVVARANRVKGG